MRHFDYAKGDIIDCYTLDCAYDYVLTNVAAADFGTVVERALSTELGLRELDDETSTTPRHDHDLSHDRCLTDGGSVEEGRPAVYLLI